MTIQYIDENVERPLKLRVPKGKYLFVILKKLAISILKEKINTISNFLKKCNTLFQIIVATRLECKIPPQEGLDETPLHVR